MNFPTDLELKLCPIHGELLVYRDETHCQFCCKPLVKEEVPPAYDLQISSGAAVRGRSFSDASASG